MNSKLISLTLIIFFALSVKGYAQKIDTIYHINGNILTGDFKKMEYGVVTWKMDGMGTISLEEPKISSIKSQKKFEIKLKNGLVYFGTFDSSAYARKVNIIISNGIELVNIDQIVEVYPIKRNFWQRTSGNFSLGINYSKGSNLATISFAGNLNYRKRNSNFELSWDDYNTWQIQPDTTIKTTKADFSLGWERLLKKKWSIGTFVGLDQNSELGTKLRLNLTVTGIYDFVYNKWNRFYVGAGLSAVRETPYDTSGITNDLAGVAGVYWKVYKYTNPKIWVDANISYVPYFTSSGRYRLDFGVSPKISVISNDLKLGFKFYYSYDSQPSTQSAATNDWGINLEITYSFH